ncbi:DUF3311 domain-containing protein [Tengunoibacter tsumagoiensis]|uniref:Membrane protein n=1 Tax=Tengunoibacter tsumagoiensis TaxID=2014871 RepID=A0A402A2C9_9CHLR|nr:DUF3311 domain-containing protein [Tengunoibacter tsumagoiensis]GCE13318.1 membrane protein [Tengunoibacter tsumagoiensis]
MALKPDRRRWLSLLFLIPFIALLCTPLYNRYNPTLIGIPFFYWYQFFCVLLVMLISAIVYWYEK